MISPLDKEQLPVVGWVLSNEVIVESEMETKEFTRIQISPPLEHSRQGCLKLLQRNLVLLGTSTAILLQGQPVSLPSYPEQAKESRQPKYNRNLPPCSRN